MYPSIHLPIHPFPLHLFILSSYHLSNPLTFPLIYLSSIPSFIRLSTRREKSESVSCSVMSDSLRSQGLYSPPGSSVHRILQTRILEWLAIPFSRRSSQPKDRIWVSCIEGGFFTALTTREAMNTSISSTIHSFLQSSFHTDHFLKLCWCTNTGWRSTDHLPLELLMALRKEKCNMRVWEGTQQGSWCMYVLRT